MQRATAAPVHVHKFSQQQGEKLFEQATAIDAILGNIIVAQKLHLEALQCTSVKSKRQQ